MLTTMLPSTCWQPGRPMVTEAADSPPLATTPEIAYLDANIILSYLLGEPHTMAQAARAFFGSAEHGEIRLLLTSTTLAEVVWVLASAYGKERQEIATQMLAFVTARGIEADNEATLALSLFRDKNIDMADALLAARALLIGPPVVYSFDRHFDRVPGILRRAPSQTT